MKNKIIIIVINIVIVAILSLSFVSCTNTPVKEETKITESDMGEKEMSKDTTKEITTMESTDDKDTKEEEAMISYMDVSPEEAKKLIDENPDLVIIDVSPNYNDGHIPGAISYYIGDGSLEKAIPTLDPNGKYLVYCHVDSVAIAGAQALIDAGFKNVYRLEGNYSAWVEAGYPVEK